MHQQQRSYNTFSLNKVIAFLNNFLHLKEAFYINSIIIIYELYDFNYIYHLVFDNLYYIVFIHNSIILFFVEGENKIISSLTYCSETLNVVS